MISIFYLSLLTFIAGVVATLTGFGTSTIMIPILSLFMPFPTVLFFVAIIHLIINLWKFILLRQHVNWLFVFYFGIPGIITSFVGGLRVAKDPVLLSHFLGAFLIIYVFFAFINPTFKLKANKFFAMLGGGISGFLAGIIGMRGALQTAFLSSFNLPKISHISTLAVIGFFIDTSRLLAYTRSKIILPSNLLYGLIIYVPVAFLGVHLAYYLVDKIPQRSFRMVVSVFLLVVGIKLLIWGAKPF